MTVCDGDHIAESEDRSSRAHHEPKLSRSSPNRIGGSAYQTSLRGASDIARFPGVCRGLSRPARQGYTRQLGGLFCVKLSAASRMVFTFGTDVRRSLMPMRGWHDGRST
jgi:hypothetical protein